jgi:hypothetical protein
MDIIRRRELPHTSEQEIKKEIHPMSDREQQAETNNSVQHGDSDISQQPWKRRRFNGLFAAKRDAVFHILLSLNQGGCNLRPEEIVDEAIKQADSLEKRNMACWFVKRNFPQTGHQPYRPPQATQDRNA